jgi:hypothetical protein
MHCIVYIRGGIATLPNGQWQRQAVQAGHQTKGYGVQG